MNRQTSAHRQRDTMVITFAPSAAPRNHEVTPRPAARKGSILIWTGALLALLTTGAWFRFQGASEISEENPSSPVRQVNVTQPQRAGAGNLVLPATIQAYEATDLFARANGYLKAWHVEIGAQVQKGQLLAEIETPELDQELAQAVALLKQGRAEHQQTIAELQEAKADVALAEANVTKAKANLDFAVSVAHRSSTLHNSRSVSREDFESTVRERDARSAELASAKAELARRQVNLATRQAIIDSRAAIVANREANVQRLRDLTGFQKITAPFAGIITRRNAEVGMLVTTGTNPGNKPLYSVARIDVLRVQAAVPQSSALGIKAGDAVQVAIPEQPGAPISAKVARTTGAVDPTSRSLLVEVELPNDAATILPGIYAQVRFHTGTDRPRWVIPANTLLLRSSGPHVVIVAGDNSLHTRKVTLGRDFGTSVEVLVGLEGNEQLVVNPTDDVRDGEMVQRAKRQDRVARN